MSWSVSFKGTPEQVIQSLDENSAKLGGQSKVEYNNALPYLKGLVGQNFGNGEALEIRVDAGGHGYAEGGEQKQRYVWARINC